jgi:HlyD family secretion protein
MPQSETPAPPKKRFSWTKLALALLVPALVVPVAVRVARGPEVPVTRVSRKAIVRKVVANGRVLPLAQVSLGVQVPGAVAEVKVEEGQKVKEGDLLVRLDDDELAAAVTQARAGLSAAAARQLKLAVLDAPVAGDELARAELDLSKAVADLNRTKALVEGGSLPPTQLEDAQHAVDRARKARSSAALRAQDASSGGAEALVVRASVAQAQGAVAAAEARLRLSRILAPASGTILTRAVEPGDVVQPGKVLLVLARDGETRLLVQPDERNLAVLAVGQRARASTEAFPGEFFDAEVRIIAPSVDPGRGTIEVKLAVPNPPAYLRAGMTVSVDVKVGERAATLVIPADAVRDAATPAPYVLVLKGGRVARVPVQLGLRSEAAVEVASGLAENDLVLLSTAGAPTAGARAPGDRARPRLEE